jgi:glycerol-3-phosphate acyltransferase PlsY
MSVMTGWWIVCCAGAFLVGGIPFGYLAGRLVLHDDIRKFGSGNIGATNVARVIGWKWAVVVLVLDALKGLLPTLLTGLVLRQQQVAAEQPGQIVAGLCAILGHMYPVWLKLRGGKGVATALGVVLVLAPLASAAALAAFAIVAGVSRVVALGSMTAAATFAATQLTLSGHTALQWPHWPLTLFSVLVPSMIVWRHRSNIRRMWRGEESPLLPAGNGPHPGGQAAEREP